MHVWQPQAAPTVRQSDLLWAYCGSVGRLPDRQSAYRAFRSTETTIAGLMSDILLSLDFGDIAALALLDLYLRHSTWWTTPSCSSVCELHLV